MTALALLAAVVVSQPAPVPVGLTLALSVKVPPEREQKVLDLLTRELGDAGLLTRRFDARCSGDLGCLADFARRDGLPGLVAVTLGASGREVVIDLEAVRSDDHASVAQLTFTSEKTLSAGTREKLRKFAESAEAGLKPKPVVSDAPVAPKLAPVTGEPPTEVIVPTPVRASRSKLPGVLLGVGTAAAAGASAGFGVVGLGQQSRANASPDGINSQLTLAEAGRLTSQANTNFTVSLAAGIAAGALLTATVVWLVSGPSEEPAADGAGGR